MSKKIVNNMNKKESFLQEVISYSKKSSTEIHKSLGFSGQKWDWYKNQSIDSFPLKLLPSLRIAANIGIMRFYALVEKHFPAKIIIETRIVYADKKSANK